jgi:WD40 repeat protein
LSDAEGRPLVDLPVIPGMVTAAAWSRDGGRVIVGGRDRMARIYDATTGALLDELGPHEESIDAVALADDGARAAVSAGARVALWDVHLDVRSADAVRALRKRVPLVLEGGQLIAGASRSAPPPEAIRIPGSTEAWHSLFDGAQVSYETHRYGDAARLFLDAYSVSSSPALLYNAAVCYEKLHDYDRAIEYFRRYLTEQKGATDRAAIQTRIEALTRLRGSSP